MFVDFIDKVMQRYVEENITIRKLRIEFPMIDVKFEPFLDKWIEIAVKIQVQELTIHNIGPGTLCYSLPEITFSAKSLKVLDCENVNLPYYKTMELISLECLFLVLENVNKVMLQRIISGCPLIDLTIQKGVLQEITLPWIGKANIKASPLRMFAYWGFSVDSLWPWNINVGALRNLRKVEIIEASITDDVVSQLASGLVALEILTLYSCAELRCIKVSSISLKEFNFIDKWNLEKATIDTPNLVEFRCNCLLEASISLISAKGCCNTDFSPWMELIDIFWFADLKDFLIETNIFKVLVINFFTCPSVQIVLEDEFLKNISTIAPYKLRELKLLQTRTYLREESTLAAFLDCLFWSCHPDVLSITTGFEDVPVKLIFDILMKKVQCWKHPLKSIEVEGSGLCTLYSKPTTIEIRFRLFWKSFPSETE